MILNCRAVQIELKGHTMRYIDKIIYLSIFKYLRIYIPKCNFGFVGFFLIKKIYISNSKY